MQNLFCNKNRGLMESQASLTTAFPNDTNFTDGTLPMTWSAVTASLSLMESFSIFLTFWMSADLRTTARRMIMFITVGDFLFACTTIVDYWEDRLGSTSYFVPTLEVTIPRVMALVSSTEFNFWQTLKLGTSAGSGMKKLGGQCASGQLLQERAGPSWHT